MPHTTRNNLPNDAHSPATCDRAVRPVLEIADVVLDTLRDVTGLAQTLATRDPALALRLQEASRSVAIKIADACTARDAQRQVHYTNALGAIRETLATLRVAAAVGYLPPLRSVVTERIDHISDVLQKLTPY